MMRMPRSRAPSRPPTRPASPAQPPYRPLPPYKKEEDSAGLLVLGVTGGLVALAVWLAGRGGANGPGNPVVNIGPDQTVTEDAQGNAQVVIDYTVTSDNPAALVWSGSPGVTITENVPGQVIARFTSDGVYSIRLTATDTVTGKIGFDELVVTVRPLDILKAELVSGRLILLGEKVSEFHAVRTPGEPISFSWPCQNIGSINGTAFMALRKGDQPLGLGPSLPVAAGQTISLNLTYSVNLPNGVHNLIAESVSILPTGGLEVFGSQAVTLEVVSPAVLSVVGLPRINGVEGATHITLPMGAPISIEWPVRNTGGDTGRARMNTDRWGLGTFVTIPGGQTVSLLTAQTADPVTPGTRTVVITVQDEFLQTLDTFTFSFTAFSP